MVDTNTRPGAEPDNLAELEATVHRLRELHSEADAADQPHAALLLGLAISNLAGHLPRDDQRLPELVREGLHRLDESAVDTVAVAQSRAVLHGCLPPTDVPAPDCLRFTTGDPTWNVDWSAMQGAMDGARAIAEALRLLEPCLPEELRSAGLTQVMNAMDRGEWRPEDDAALANFTRFMSDAGVPDDVSMPYRALSMMIRIHRCGPLDSTNQSANWPTPAELDELVTELEKTDPIQGLGPPFDVFAGIHRLWAGYPMPGR